MLEKIETLHGIFTSNEFTGQTAQEVYDEWIENKDKPPEPTENEVLRDYILDVDYRLIMMELGL